LTTTALPGSPVQVTRFSNLSRLGKSISVPIRPDDDGYLGRECPVEECLGYFKVTPGTGIQGPAQCHCPYCGHSGDSKTFWTKEQIEYAKSVVFRKITDAIHDDLKSLEFDQRSRSGIGLSLKIEQSTPRPIRYYREKQLETEVVCDKCALRYAIYGVFGWCPDCGEHNSLQILSKNLEMAKKELNLADSLERQLADHLVGDALENVVAAFDGFGREVCARRAADIPFQSLIGARRRVQETFGFDFADGLTEDEWNTANRLFQKRHLLAHKMGVVDEEYVRKTADPQAVIGRKVSFGGDEIRATICIVEALGKRLFEGALSRKAQPIG
jgi:hypothetical protein